MMNDWRSARNNPPAEGQRVEIRHNNTPLNVSDVVYWYPRQGNWPVDQLWWRPVQDEE